MLSGINNIRVYGLEEAVKASKYPMLVNTSDATTDVTKTQDKLAQADIGSGHDQFLTGVIVQFDLTFTIKAWTELQRYHFIDFVSSQSTMHRIAAFTISEQVCEYVDSRVTDVVCELANKYNTTHDKEDYLRLLYNVPCGLQLTAAMTTNYRQLKTIYKQRKNHRLPEWRVFCEQLKDLPHSEWITGE